MPEQPTVPDLVAEIVRKGAERDALQLEINELMAEFERRSTEVPVIAELFARSRVAAPPAPSKPRARSTSRDQSPAGSIPQTIISTLTEAGVAMTASEVVSAAGLPVTKRGSISTAMNKMAKTGQLVKGDRGYALPA